jgi:[acyl-carrier-protein] S-malonyltransferase
MKFALVFPGQGSQSVGMMAAYGDAPVIRATFDEASNALGRDLWRLVADGPAEALSQTVNTQPLMLTAGIAVYRALAGQGRARAGHGGRPQPGRIRGAGGRRRCELKDAVPLVELRAKAMQEAVPAGVGAMAAVMGLDAEGVVAAPAPRRRRARWCRRSISTNPNRR